MAKARKRKLCVCQGTACRAKGADLFLRMLERRDAERQKVQVIASPCIGRCQEAPAVLDEDQLMGKLNSASFARELDRIGLAS